MTHYFIDHPLCASPSIKREKREQQKGRRDSIAGKGRGGGERRWRKRGKGNKIVLDRGKVRESKQQWLWGGTGMVGV